MHLGGRFSRLALLCLVLSTWTAAVTSCKEPTPPAPRDQMPPTIRVEFPYQGVYDEDGDSLVDVRLTWADMANGVDPASARLRVLQGVNGPADTAGDLLPFWRVTQRDSAGLTVHETIENLLHGGPNDVVVSVADRVGNVRSVTIHLTLPPAAWFKKIVTGVTRTDWWIVGATVCPDDHRLYAAASEQMVVVDTDSLRMVKLVRSPPLATDMNFVLCIPDSPILYATSLVERFDRHTLTFLPEVDESFGTIGIVQSRLDPNLLYVGESGGSIGVIDRAANRRRPEDLFPYTPGHEEQEFALAVLPGDTKLYATRLIQSGVLVIDPRTGQELHRIRVGGPNWPDYGIADHLELAPDDAHLYVSVEDGSPRGFLEIDTRTDSVTRFLPLPDEVPAIFAISPSGRRAFLTTRNRWLTVPVTHELIDLSTFQVLRSFPRVEIPGVTRRDGEPAFRPDGKIFFVGHDLDIDVYLNRE